MTGNNYFFTKKSQVFRGEGFGTVLKGTSGSTVNMSQYCSVLPGHIPHLLSFKKKDCGDAGD